MESINKYISLGENKYQENTGLYFEEFTIGDIIKHWPGRTLTDIDNTWLSLIGMNNHPLHIDHIYASNTEFKKPVISSAVTFSIVNGMTVSTISARAIANLGWDKVRLLTPVFSGETIYAETKIIAKRLCNSRQNAGIVRVSTKGIKSTNETFMTFERIIMIPTKGIIKK